MSVVKTGPVTNSCHWGNSFLFQIEQVNLSIPKSNVSPSAWVSSTAIWSVSCDVHISKTFTKRPKPWTAYQTELALLHSICHGPYVKLSQTLNFYRDISLLRCFNTITHTMFLLRPQYLYLQFVCHTLKVRSNRLPLPADLESVQVSSTTQDIWNGLQ